MRIDNECLIIDSEIRFPSNLNLNLSKLLSNGSSTRVIIIINILYVKNDIFLHPIPFKDGFEFVLPVSPLVKFKGLHGFNVNNVHIV